MDPVPARPNMRGGHGLGRRRRFPGIETWGRGGTLEAWDEVEKGAECNPWIPHGALLRPRTTEYRVSRDARMGRVQTVLV